jgi:hypothetical protein
VEPYELELPASLTPIKSSNTDTNTDPNTITNTDTGRSSTKKVVDTSRLTRLCISTNNSLRDLIHQNLPLKIEYLDSINLTLFSCYPLFSSFP